MVEVLVEAGAEIDKLNQHNNKALYSAVYIGDSGTIKVLLKAGATLDENMMKQLQPSDQESHYEIKIKAKPIANQSKVKAKKFPDWQEILLDAGISNMLNPEKSMALYRIQLI